MAIVNDHPYHVPHDVTDASVFRSRTPHLRKQPLHRVRSWPIAVTRCSILTDRNRCTAAIPSRQPIPSMTVIPPSLPLVMTPVLVYPAPMGMGSGGGQEQGEEEGR